MTMSCAPAVSWEIPGAGIPIRSTVTANVKYVIFFIHHSSQSTNARLKENNHRGAYPVGNLSRLIVGQIAEDFPLKRNRRDRLIPQADNVPYGVIGVIDFVVIIPAVQPVK